MLITLASPDLSLYVFNCLLLGALDSDLRAVGVSQVSSQRTHARGARRAALAESGLEANHLPLIETRLLTAARALPRPLMIVQNPIPVGQLSAG